MPPNGRFRLATSAEVSAAIEAHLDEQESHERRGKRPVSFRRRLRSIREILRSSCLRRAPMQAANWAVG